MRVCINVSYLIAHSTLQLTCHRSEMLHPIASGAWSDSAFGAVAEKCRTDTTRGISGCPASRRNACPFALAIARFSFDLTPFCHSASEITALRSELHWLKPPGGKACFPLPTTAPLPNPPTLGLPNNFHLPEHRKVVPPGNCIPFVDIHQHRFNSIHAEMLSFGKACTPL